MDSKFQSPSRGVGGGNSSGSNRPRWKFHLNLMLFLLLLFSKRSLATGGEIESCIKLMHSAGQASSSGGSGLLNDGGSSGSSSNSIGTEHHPMIQCQIRTLHPDLDIENLTSSGGIEPGSITRLKLVCNDVLFFESGVGPGQLSALSELHEIVIEKCKLKHVPADFLSGLRHLKKLSINTGNSEWAARSLEISPGAFTSTPQLRHINLGFNHMWNIPERLLCQGGSLQNLQTLNLTHNLLNDIDDLGLPQSRLLPLLPPLQEFSSRISSSPSSSSPLQDGCLGELKSFDLSYNSLRTLGSRRLERMRRLQEFRVDHNWLEELEDDAFTGLNQLRLLNLSSNRLVALPPRLFQSSKLIQELDLRNNSLTALSPGLFGGLEHLQTLDLSINSLSSQWITAEAFKSLVRLVILNLSHNQLTHLAPSTFNELYSLQVLDLGNNLISSIDDGTFAKMSNLHALNLGRNRLISVNSNMFNGLYVLHKLILDYNQIEGIENGALRNCTSLQDLGLVGNKLPQVPEALKGLQLLRTLDLGENRITSLNNESFTGMSQLYGLRLVDNQLEEVPKGLCDPLSRLRVFNIAQNRIHKISSASFIACPELKVLRLDSNKLEELPPNLAPQLPNLLWLNVSENRIRWADYSLLPSTLEWFDVSHNQLETLGGAWSKKSSGDAAAAAAATTQNSRQSSHPNQNVKLRVVDASHNQLSQLDYHAVPANLEVLKLGHNRLKRIIPDTFSHSSHLRRVELIGNQLENIPLNALRLPPIPAGRPLPEFFLGGNPLLCECSMEWLLRINQLSTLRQHPTVLDLDAIVCRVSFSRTVTHIPLPDIKPQDFLCPYKSHCFALCHCCDFDACDCQMSCPSNCTCYHDHNWSANVVNCASSGYANVPSVLPMDSTEVYLDGNNIPSLKSHTFIGRKNLRVLFLNSSRIETIHNKSFNGLQQLQNLHLENNLLRSLQGYEFDHLTRLRELYLHDNLIESITNTTFLPLKSLEILRLDGNRLVIFTVWQLSLNPYLVEIGLARNQWNCDCQFLHQLYSWVTDNSRKLVDIGQLQCYWNTTHKPGPHLMDYNRTCGSSWALMDGSGAFMDFTYSPLPLIFSIISLIILLIILVIVMILCRDNIRLFFFTQFGVRICSATGGSSSDYDDEKLYDAYFIYSQKDEETLTQKIADELETNDSYRLCLHYRDLISETTGAGALKEMIFGAAENSKSVVILLSRNFLQGEWTMGDHRTAFNAFLKKSQKKSEVRQKVVVLFIDDDELSPNDVCPEIRSWVRHNRIQVIKWNPNSQDERKQKKFLLNLKYFLHPPSSHYNSNITGSNTTTATSTGGDSTAGVVGVGGVLATLKYNGNDSSQHQIIIDELNRSNKMQWTNFVALPPPKYSQTVSANNYNPQTLSLNNHRNYAPASHYNNPPLPPKSPPSSQSTDSTTTNGGDETQSIKSVNNTPNSFSYLFQQQMQQTKSPVPVPKSLYSLNSTCSSNHGGGESYLSLERENEHEHVYSMIDPPSPISSAPNTGNRLLNNIHLPNGYTYQPQMALAQPQPQQQWHSNGSTKGSTSYGSSKYKTAKDGNPVQTYLV